MKGAFILSAMALTSATAMPAHAHSWYPRECCSVEDCAPVERIDRLADTGQWMITSKNGKAILRRSLPQRDSQDGRAHVCTRYDAFGELEVICLFMPPGM